MPLDCFSTNTQASCKLYITIKRQHIKAKDLTCVTLSQTPLFQTHIVQPEIFIVFLGLACQSSQDEKRSGVIKMARATVTRYYVSKT